MDCWRTFGAKKGPRPFGRAQGQAGGGAGAPGPWTLGCRFPTKMTFSIFHGHGCRWKDPSDLSPACTKTLKEDAFLRPNGHFEDKPGFRQHSRRGRQGKQGRPPHSYHRGGGGRFIRVSFFRGFGSDWVPAGTPAAAKAAADFLIPPSPT